MYMSIKKKIMSLFLAATIAVGSIPLNVFAASGTSGTGANKADYLEKVADASTQDIWGELTENHQSTKNIGRIWTDKSVFTDGASLEYKFNDKGGITGAESRNLSMNTDADFQVVLSAISSTQSIHEQTNAPVDVMFILDISSSMYGSSYNMTNLRSLVNSVNQTVENVQNLNDYNRVGVVLYYGGDGYLLNDQSTTEESAMVLLELGRYTNSSKTGTDTSGKYVYLNEEGKSVQSAENLKKNNASYKVRSRELPTIAGTYMQLGILQAMEQFKSVSTTSSAKGDTKEHIPVFILMSDGEPTASTNNFWKIENAKFGNNTVDYRNPAESDFVTQLTAAYAKAEVDIYYGSTAPLFYTLSLGDDVSLDVMDPGKTITISGASERNEDTIKGYWNTLINSNSVEYLTYPHELDSSYNNAKKYTTEDTNLSNGSDFPSNIAQMQYVDRAYTAATAGNLEKAFDNIYQEIVTLVGSSPTFISGNDISAGGYVTLVDELGDYMEIKSVDAITIEGEIYNYTDTGVGSSQDTTTTSAYTETTYTFEKAVSLNTTLAARTTGERDNENLNHIIITERDYTDASIRDTLTVKIPASLLPLRYYTVDGNGALTIKETLPVRVVYSVGLLDDVRSALTNGNYSSVSGLNNYVKTHTNKNNSNLIEFFSNYSDGTDSNNDGYTDGNSYSTFVPATNNSFYYYTENTVFYRQSDSSQGAGSVQGADGKYYTPISKTNGYEADLKDITVYYPHTYYNKDKDSGVTTKVTDYIGLDIAAAINRIGSITWGNISNYIGINADGYYYMKAGNAKLSLANDVRFIDLKSDETGNNNKEGGNTDTATTVVNPTWNANAIGGRYDTYSTINYLGNNGKITFAGKGNLVITKDVQADAGLTPNADAEFEFTVTLTGADVYESGKTYSYPANHTGNENTTSLTFTSSSAGTATAKVNLKNNEAFKIIGIPAGVSWTVEEATKSGYTIIYNDSDGTTNDGRGTISVGDNDTSAVLNKYSVVPASTNFNLSGNKTFTILEGSDYSGTPTFKFYLQYWKSEIVGEGQNTGHWMYVKSDGGKSETKSEGVYDTITYSSGEKDVKTITYTNINTALNNCQFTSPGEYMFRVIEENSGSTINGIYYDDTVHSFIVIVKDNGNGALYVDSVASAHGTTSIWSKDESQNPIKWTNGDIDFNNTYGTDKLNIRIDKAINDTTGSGYNKMDGYKFNWTYLGYNLSPANDFSDTGVNAWIFKNTETGSGKSGTVESTKDGIASFAIEYDVTNQIIVDGTATEVTAPIITSTGKHIYLPFSGEEQNDGNGGTVTVLSKSYYEYYHITEDKTSDRDDDNLTYSNQEYIVQVVVTVTDNEIETTYSVVQYTVNNEANPKTTYTYKDYNETTKLHSWTTSEGATITRTENDDIIFANTYSDDIAVTLGVTKKLTGRDWKAGEGGDSFKFTLTPIQYNNTLGEKFILSDADGNGTYTAVKSDNISTGTAIQATITNVSEVESANTNFAPITFTEVGTYYFAVSETKAGTTEKGITYDDTIHYVKVVVTADADHYLRATVSTYLKGQITANNNVYTIADFTNKYTARPVSVTLGGTKTLEGRTLNDQEFIFELISTNNDVIYTANNSIGAYVFPRLTFDAAGTYTYTIKEQNGNLGGVAYSDAVYTVTIVVTDNGTGQLKATVKNGDTAITKDTQDNYTGFDFTNTYKATGKANLLVNKTISGREWQLGDSFTFELYSADNTKLNEFLIKAPEELSDGFVTLESVLDIDIESAGEYTYYLKEKDTGNKGIEFDKTVYKVTITATDNGDGTFDIKQNYAIVSDSVEATASGIGFTNVYSPDPAKVNFTVGKTLAGRNWKADDSFTFTLAAVTADTPMPASGGETVTADSTSQSVNFGEIEFRKTGTYEYTIKESKGGSAINGVTYDNTIYNVKVVVEDDLSGELKATITYNGKSTEKAEFINVYSATGEFKLSGTKILSGRDIKDGEFKFTLKNSNGAVLSTAENKGNTFTFGTVFFTTEDVKDGYVVCYVSEDKTGIAGIFYDNTVYRVKIKVTDDGMGNLTVDNIRYSIEGSSSENVTELKFTNSYSHEDKTPPVPLNPDTSDPINVNIWLGMMIISGCGIAALIYLNKKHKEELTTDE